MILGRNMPHGIWNKHMYTTHHILGMHWCPSNVLAILSVFWWFRSYCVAFHWFIDLNFCVRTVPSKTYQRNYGIHCNTASNIRDTALHWPTPNSPDLNPVDYKVWVVMLERVYCTHVRYSTLLIWKRLTDAWSGLQQHVVDEEIDRRRRRLCAKQAYSRGLALLCRSCCHKLTYIPDCRMLATNRPMCNYGIDFYLSLWPTALAIVRYV